MDPNSNLAEQLELAEKLIAEYDRNYHVDEEEADRLAELVIALDEWLRKGGFLPCPWVRP
jgi:proline dehydrogenase